MSQPTLKIEEAAEDPNYVPSSLQPKQSKNQNPKIGRPAKTNQQEQFKNYYLSPTNKNSNWNANFSSISISNILTRWPKTPSTKESPLQNESLIFRLKVLNQAYFKNSSFYPQQKLRYTSVIDVAYMLKVFKDKHGDKISCSQLLMIIFFFLYNEKLVNEEFYQYFKNNFIKFKEGIIFGPSGKSSKLDKMDKLIVCLALELAIRQNVMIQEEVQYSDEQEQDQQEGNSKNQAVSLKRSHSQLDN